MDNNEFEYVDLGLPSGTLWAKCNVGAESETDYGLYFAWGEVIGYPLRQIHMFDENNYQHYVHDYSIVDDNKSNDFPMLRTEWDAAHVNMGGRWKMPNYEQAKELLSLEQKIVNIDKVKCVQFNGINGNTLLVPCGGNRGSDKSFGVNVAAHLWTSQHSKTITGSAMTFDLFRGKEKFETGHITVHLGINVRGVIDT